MKFVVCLLVLLSAGPAWAQTAAVSDCPLPAHNARWITQFQAAGSTAERWQLIRAKLRADSVYAAPSDGLLIRDRMLRNETANAAGQSCGCRLLFFAFFRGGSVELNLNGQPAQAAVLNGIEAGQIRRIEGLFGDSAGALFGARAACGAVYLETRNRALSRQLRALMVPPK
ncbi:hypothetical protein [Hymenobacter sp. B81]|uniref:hypothetical protein n=1 Tax=Hymenobacter sp. B81 TaxID=3344878 RepID=UPI0037DDB936